MAFIIFQKSFPLQSTTYVNLIFLFLMSIKFELSKPLNVSLKVFVSQVPNFSSQTLTFSSLLKKISVKKLFISGLRRAGQQVQRKRLQNRESARKIRENALFNIKESEPLSTLKSNCTPFLHFCCSSCTPASKVQNDEFGAQAGVVNSVKLRAQREKLANPRFTSH